MFRLVKVNYYFEFNYQYIRVLVVFFFKDIYGDYYWKLVLKRYRFYVGEVFWIMYKKEFSEFTVSMINKNVLVKF